MDRYPCAIDNPDPSMLTNPNPSAAIFERNTKEKSESRYGLFQGCLGRLLLESLENSRRVGFSGPGSHWDRTLPTEDGGNDYSLMLRQGWHLHATRLIVPCLDSAKATCWIQTCPGKPSKGILLDGLIAFTFVRYDIQNNANTGQQND